MVSHIVRWVVVPTALAIVILGSLGAQVSAPEPFDSALASADLRTVGAGVVWMDDALFTIAQSGDGGRNLYRVDPERMDALPLLSPQQAAQYLFHRVEHLAADTIRGRIVFLNYYEATSTWDMPSRIVSYDPKAQALSVLADNGRYNTHLVFSPDGSKLAFFSAPAQIHYQQHSGMPEGGYALHVLDLATGEERQVAPPNLIPFPPSAPTWSPDGQLLAFSGLYQEGEVRGRPLYVVQENGEDLHALPIAGRYFTESAVWPTADTLILYSNSATGLPGGRGLYRLNLETMSCEPIEEIGIDGDTLSLSPDRQFICFGHIGPDGRISDRVLTVDGQEPQGDLSDRLFHGTWRLTSTPASP